MSIPRNQILIGDCLDVMRTLPDGCCCLAITSPPYEDARTYSIGFQLAGQDWVDWMIPRVIEMCRVTNGLVFVNAAGKTRDWKYSPVMEWLVADLTRKHGIVCGPAPYVFYRIGIPGSGASKYHRRDWEPIYAFARPENVPPAWTDNTCMGHPPKWAPGGELSNRTEDGRRKNTEQSQNNPRKNKLAGRDKWGNADGSRKTRTFAEKVDAGAKVHTKADADEMRDQAYLPPVLANPGNVIQEKYTAEQVNQLLEHPGDVVKCLVGGGVMGDPLCHENEAPFPETLVEFFIRSFCPEGGIALDPFVGSGTVPKVAQRWGRHYLGIDIRDSQVKLASRRLNEHGQPLFGDAA